ncbi:UNVERIFIED_CONTAM: hypothetical protein K2H54_053322, partial [Gekko kuhli]
AIEKLVAVLDTLDRWIDETPPVDQPSRFGNKAFRTWYAKLDQGAEELVATVVPKHLVEAVPEVAVYLKEAVGNSTRIDYGTGHEAAFAAFLCCLCKIGVLRVDDQLAIVFKVFNRYLEVMRKLQKTYRMEPAGSQGVWGLDDFQFLPFIWGSSQLIDHPNLEPRHFVDEKVVNENHKDYMFLECIMFITEQNQDLGESLAGHKSTANRPHFELVSHFLEQPACYPLKCQADDKDLLLDMAHTPSAQHWCTQNVLIGSQKQSRMLLLNEKELPPPPHPKLLVFAI